MRKPAIIQKVLTGFGYFFWINVAVILLLNWIAYVEIGYLPEVQEDFPLGFLGGKVRYSFINAFLAEDLLFPTWFGSLFVSFILSPIYLCNVLLYWLFKVEQDLSKPNLSFSLFGFILFNLLNFQFLIERYLYKWTSISLEIHDWTWWFMD